MMEIIPTSFYKNIYTKEDNVIISWKIRPGKYIYEVTAVNKPADGNGCESGVEKQILLDASRYSYTH